MPTFKRIINVIPLTRVKLSGPQFFTYLVPPKLYDQLRPGLLIKIPFGSRKLFGLTSSFEMHRLAGEVKSLKYLEGLVKENFLVNEKTLALAYWLSTYYLCPLGLVVKSMVPTMSIKHSKPPILVGYEPFDPDFVLTEHQRAAVSRVTLAQGRAQTFLLIGERGSGKTEVYFQILKRVRETGQQGLLLLPEIALTDETLKQFARRFGIKNLAFLHSQIRGAERLFMWEKIREGLASVIIGTRSAVFSSFKNLGLIIVDDEHDPSYKQKDQHPKYDARVVARKLSDLWNCPLLFGSSTPTLEAYFEAKSGEATFLSLPFRLKADIVRPKIQVVDMAEERKSGNFSVLSEFLKLAILENLRTKRQIILFSNRRGAASFVTCRDCSFVPVCENCSLSLVWHEAVKFLICHCCGKKYPLPTFCPQCGGYEISFRGSGTQQIEEELKRFLMKNLDPQKFPTVARLDSDAAPTPDKVQKLRENWKKAETMVLIATQMINKTWTSPKLGLLAVVSADKLLSLPDFRAQEQAFHTLAELVELGAMGGVKLSVRMILQTFRSQNLVFSTLRTGNFEKLYEAFLAARQHFNFPPYCRIIKLTVKNLDSKKAQKKAEEMSDQLKKRGAWELFGPFPAYIFKKRGLYHYQVALKLKTRKTLEGLLSDLPSDVDIDVDPVSLL